jgi:predicted alpha/beta superfamily hydrolase
MDSLGPFALDNSHTHDFVAKSNGQAYRVWVSTPAKRVPGQLRPVLYLTDANSSFATLTETTRMLAFSGEIPPVIVVGIGYPTGRIADAMRLRNYELTPTVDSDYIERAAQQGQPVDERGLGGAPGFLQFIAEEVAPFVEDAYGGDRGDRALYGYSLGGLFVAWALLQDRPAFHRYVAGSPSLWWDNRVLFELEAKRAQAATALPARFFISAGEDEEAPRRRYMTPFKMVSNAIEFAGRLASRDYDGLEVDLHLIPKVGHQAPPMLVQGLQSVYRGHPGIVRPPG